LNVQMKKELFDSLSVDATGHACFEPMVSVYQEGIRRRRNSNEAYEYRIEFYKSLSQGQQALLGFFTYYDHAIRSNVEFQGISKNYLSQQIFGIVKKGAEYFNDNDMCQLLLRIEQSILADIQNDELYRQFCEIAPRTLAKIGACIKENPTEFICFSLH